MTMKRFICGLLALFLALAPLHAAIAAPPARIAILSPPDPYQSTALVLDWGVSSGRSVFKGPDGSRYSSFAAYQAAQPLRTNYIRNSAMSGASAGVLPTNWVTTASGGVAWTVVGTGSENGLNYVDLKLSGTSTGTSNAIIRFDAINNVPASASQVWSNSVYARISAGDLTNITANLLVGGSSADGATVTGTFAITSLGLTSSFARTTQSGTTAASTVNVVSYIQVGVQSGAVNVTIRIYAPQLEMSSISTAFIPTTSAAASSGVSFARTGAGTAQKKDGTVVSFATGIPRETDNGLLIEEARTNLVTYSQNQIQSWTRNNTIASTGIASPDGATGGINYSNTLGVGSFFTVGTGTLANNTTYTRTIYAKAVTGTGLLAFEVSTGSVTTSVQFNLITGTIINSPAFGSGSIVAVGSAWPGWYLCSFTFTTASTGTPQASVTYVGSYGGTSTATTITVWQADLQVGAFPTSPIITNGASATRGADGAYVAGLGSVLGAPITMSVRGNMYVANDGVRRALAVANDNSNTNRLVFWRDTDNTAQIGEVISSTFQTGITVAGKTGARALSLAGRFKTSALSGSVDGAAVANGTASSFATGLNRIDIGQNALGGSGYLNGYIQRLTVQGDTTDNQLQVLTQ